MIESFTQINLKIRKNLSYLILEESILISMLISIYNIAAHRSLFSIRESGQLSRLNSNLSYEICWYGRLRLFRFRIQRKAWAAVKTVIAAAIEVVIAAVWKRKRDFMISSSYTMIVMIIKQQLYGIIKQLPLTELQSLIRPI